MTVRKLYPAELVRIREAMAKLHAPPADGEPIEWRAFERHRMDRLRAEYPDVAELVGCLE